MNTIASKKTRIYTYDDSGELVDFDDTDIEIQEKNFSGIIPIIFGIEKCSKEFIKMFVIPKKCKIEKLREMVFALAGDEKEVMEKPILGFTDSDGIKHDKVEIFKALQ